MSWHQEPTMECPTCKEIEFEHIDTIVGKDGWTYEYECRSCHQIGFFDEMFPGTREALDKLRISHE